MLIIKCIQLIFANVVYQKVVSYDSTSDSQPKYIVWYKYKWL